MNGSDSELSGLPDARFKQGDGLPAEPFLEVPLALIGQAEQQIEECIRLLKPLKEYLSKAKKTALIKARPLAQLEALVRELSGNPLESIAFNVRDFGQSLETVVKDLRKGYEERFGQALAAACEASQLLMKPAGGAFQVGPFVVFPDFVKEAAAIRYAESVVESGLRLDPAALVRRILELRDQLLQIPNDPSAIISEITAAVRILHGTTGSDQSGTIRVELPRLHEQMAINRAGPGATATQSKAQYPLVRFIVELATAVQSDENMAAEHRLRLETAVLENTRNPRKSVMIPRDLTEGWGPGVYYQAVTIT